MNPAVKRLGSVTIERLEHPKDVSLEQKAKKSSLELNESFSEEENEDSEEVFTSEEETDEEGLELPIPQSSLSVGSGNLKRTSDDLKLGPDITFKKFKPDNDKNKTSLTTHNEKKIDDSESSSEEDDSYYDSELESEDEDRQNNDIGNGEGNVKKFDHKAQKNSMPQVQDNKSDVNIDNKNKAEDNENRLENLSKTEENSSNDNLIKEPHDEEYDKDIKEKLKEMGEITFATVKKGEKPKTDSPPSTENEVVITKKSGEEVTVVSKGNLRRNIREVMDDTKLDETTLAAQRQEAERLKRVQEQQRLLREYQKQAQQERTQQRVMSLLQGNSYAKPGPSNANKVGGTVLVKLPNGQTAPMTKVPRPEFDILKVPRPEPFNTIFPPQNTSMNQIRPTAPFQMASTQQIPTKRPNNEIRLPPSLSLSPIARKLPSKSHSNTDSDSDIEESIIKDESLKNKIIDHQTIELSSDDDCIVVSESECEQNDEDEPDDPCNSGMHTNDEFNLPDDQGRVLVNVGHAEDEPDVFIAPQIAKIIKPHQIGGVRFLYDNIVETVTRFDPAGGFGCILAHSMGLGKTLQIVTFADLFLRYTSAKKILCIMPINTLQNWMAEFNIWTPTVEAAAQSALNVHGDVRPRNFNLHVLNDSHKTLVARQKVIRAWSSQGGILMIGYEQFRLLSMRKMAKNKRNKTPPASVVNLVDEDKNKPIFDEIYLALVNPGADLVICDEGHRIKNSHASISAALKQLRTKRRVVLTGYPLQNNLTEYWCMVDFVRPNYLGSKTEFLNMFERPIMNGQCIDSTESDIKLMRYRAHVLHSLLVGFVQRRSHTVLQTVLPQKEEYVLLVRLKPFQRKLYDRFMNDVVRTQTVPNPLKAFAVCCKIWNHPDVLYNFLVKRAQGEAVDLDLEEVGTVSGVSTAGETTKPRKRGSAKSRKTPAKGRNVKPAASITPYNSTPESAGISNKINDGNSPPFNNGVGGSRIPVVTNFNENGTNFHSATNNRIQYNFNENNDAINKDGKYGPYMNEFNQPRTSFEGISQFFGDYDKNPVNNTQYPQFANNSIQNNSTENQIESRLFNMDQKNTVSVVSNNSNNQNHHQNFDQFGYHPQNYWESENKLEFNNQSWIKKEDDSNQFKSEDSKNNKINIISDIKLNTTAFPSSENQKINIISDIKLEPKKDEEEFNNFEQIIIKKEDEEDVKVIENSLTKLVSLTALKDSKEDSGIPYDWAIELLKDYLPGQIENAAKFQILFCIIKESLALGDRLLVFSQSLITLDLIEQFLQMSNIPGQTYKWLRNSSYYRLDGSTGAQEREKLINEFNSNPKIFLFLVSTRAGSLGINLIGANRVIVLDASWNPCHDTQAVCRVYRYGQRKPCFVYRLVVDNCLEKKIYDRQVSKQGMSDRVVDECNPDAHLTIKDVTSLCYDDDKNDEDDEQIKDWSTLKYSYIDVVLQKVLDKYGTTLSKKPFQHESLLIDRKEKKLSQQEKRLAKKGYERDKNAAAKQPSHHSNGYGRGHRPVASVRPMPQLADRPTRWIPAEHWQRQGMTAQEMTLPLDVVIPTNQQKKGNIVLKAGQKVLVLKSPKGVYMQLESGKIVAIKTAIKVKGRADENINDPQLSTTNNIPIPGRPPQLQRPQVQNNVANNFMPGFVKFNVKSARRPPSLPNNNNFASKMQNRRINIPTARNHHHHHHSEIIPGSSSEEETESDKNSGVAELEKKISHLNKSISMRQRNIPQRVNFKESPIMERNISKQSNNIVFNNSSSYPETLDNITTTTTNLFPQNNVENIDSDDEDFVEYRSIDEDVVEKPPNEEISPELIEHKTTLGGINHQLNNEPDSVTDILSSMINKANYQTMQPKIEPSSSSLSTEPNNPPNNYSYNNYDYNIPTYQTQSLPHAQGFTYAPQPSQPAQFDNYGNYQPGNYHHYGYENFPSSQQQQSQYVAQSPNFPDYNNVAPTTVVNYPQQNYTPYPSTPRPQNIYQPSNSYPDYVQFPTPNPSSTPQIIPQEQSSNNYYQGS